MRGPSARNGLGPALFLMACGLPALIFGPSVMEAGAGLHGLAYGATPYFVPEHALMLYVAVPLVALSGIALLLGPGLMLAIALGRARTVAEWMTSGFALSLAIVTLGAMLVQAILPEPLTGLTFGLMVLVCMLISTHFAWLVSREWPRRFTVPAFCHDDKAMLLLAASLALLVIAALAPKFLWESFSADGVRRYETARLMLYQSLPLWPGNAGELATSQDVKSLLSALPASWLIRLFGPFEVSARLVYVLALIPFACALAGAIEHGQQRRMHMIERILLAGALVLFTLVMAFSSATHGPPYNADIAATAAQTALLMLIFCGYVLEFLRGRAGGSFIAAMLLCFTAPQALPMLAASLLGAALFLRPLPWRAMALTAVAAAILIALEMLAPYLLAHAHIALPMGAHDALEPFRQLAQPQTDQLMHFAWAFVPVGILPALTVALAWRWQAGITRAMTLSTLILFSFYYVLPRPTLQNFAPAGLLALIVMWRTIVGLRTMGAALVLSALTLVALVAGFILSWPNASHPIMASREVGTQIEDRTTGYESADPTLFRRIAIEQKLFPALSDPRVPQRAYGGDPLVWNHYAHRADAPEFPRNYVVQPEDYPAVPLAQRIAVQDRLALYVRDEALWRKQASRILPGYGGSALYDASVDSKPAVLLVYMEQALHKLLPSLAQEQPLKADTKKQPPAPPRP